MDVHLASIIVAIITTAPGFVALLLHSRKGQARVYIDEKRKLDDKIASLKKEVEQCERAHDESDVRHKREREEDAAECKGALKALRVIINEQGVEIRTMRDILSRYAPKDAANRRREADRP